MLQSKQDQIIQDHKSHNAVQVIHHSKDWNFFQELAGLDFTCISDCASFLRFLTTPFLPSSKESAGPAPQKAHQGTQPSAWLRIYMNDLARNDILKSWFVPGLCGRRGSQDQVGGIVCGRKPNSTACCLQSRLNTNHLRHCIPPIHSNASIPRAFFQVLEVH